MTPPASHSAAARRSRWVVGLLAVIAVTLLVGVGLFGFATYQTYRAGRAVSEAFHEKKAALQDYAAVVAEAAPAKAAPVVERWKANAEQAAADPRVQALKEKGKAKAKEKLSAWLKRH